MYTTFNVAITVMTYIFQYLNSEKAIVSSNQTIAIKYSLLKRLLSKYPYASSKDPNYTLPQIIL